MAVETEFDQPGGKRVVCELCGQPFWAKPFWMVKSQKWGFANVHAECLAKTYQPPPPKHFVPERFRGFEEIHFKYPAALEAARNWDGISTKQNALVISGPPGRGKSRLMWWTITRFFDDLQKLGPNRWVEYYIFPDLVTDFDRDLLRAVKSSTYCFIDDIGSTPSFGRERAQLQDVIRYRVQEQRWTFLTIDSAEFDPGFRDLFSGRATVIPVE